MGEQSLIGAVPPAEGVALKLTASRVLVRGCVGVESSLATFTRPRPDQVPTKKTALINARFSMLIYIIKSTV